MVGAKTHPGKKKSQFLCLLIDSKAVISALQTFQWVILPPNLIDNILCVLSHKAQFPLAMVLKILGVEKS